MKRLRLALLCSVLLHVVMLWGLKRLPEPEVVALPPPPEAQAELVWLESEPEPQAPDAPEALPARPREVVKREPAPVPPQQREGGAASGEMIPYEPEPEQRSSKVEPPREYTLVPRGEIVTVPNPEGPRGHTVHNVPGEVPSAEELYALKSEQGRKRVQAWAEGDLASARVTSGLVNPYFHSLRRELTAALVKPPEIFDPNQTNPERLKDWASQLAQSTRGGWQRYGATGVPYADPEGYTPAVPTKLAEMAANGDARARQGATTLYQGARLLEFADGRAGIDMVVIIELVQNADGSLQRAVMRRASGVKAFDQWVMAMAETSIDALEDSPPDAGARSVWEFRGKVSYLRTSKDFDVKQDAWYLMLMMPMGLAPGTFDEVSGEATYVDLRYPHYEAKVRLLQAYEKVGP